MADEKKFALPDSQQFRAFYAQKRRRSRNSNIPIVVPITKNFIDLPGDSAQSYYELDTPWVAAGDFEVEFDFTASFGNTFRNITGAIAESRYEILFTNSNDFTAFDAVEGQRIVTVAGAPYTDGKLHSCKVTRVGGLQSLFLDGVLMGSKTMPVHAVSFDAFGNKGTTTNRYEGIVSNLKLTDVSTPANSLAFGLDNLTGDTEVNNGVTLTYENIALDVRETYTLVDGDWLGSERVTNNSFADTAGWVASRGVSVLSAVSGALRATANSSSEFGHSFQLTGLVVGKAYKVIGNATSNNPSIFTRIRVGDAVGFDFTNVVDVEGVGSVSAYTSFVAIATTMYVGTSNVGHTGGDYVDIEAGISIKPLIEVAQ